MAYPEASSEYPTLYLPMSTGPTETTIGITEKRLTRRLDKWASIPTIGEIIAQSSVYFLDENLRFLKNGEIEFGGRKDGQVKIRGNRVKLSEIKIILMRGQISISKLLF